MSDNVSVSSHESRNRPKRRRASGRSRSSVNETSRSRGWVVVINNPLIEDRDRFDNLVSSHNAKFAVYQLEKGETGTPHIQGYVYFTNQRVFSVIREIFKRSDGTYHAHIEPARGSPDQNIEYCTKQSSRLTLSDRGSMPFLRGEHDTAGPFTFGERPNQGKRSDIQEAVEIIRNTGSINQVLDTHASTFVKYNGGILKLLSLYSKPRDFKTHVSWLYGSTGTGKTRYAFDEGNRIISEKEANNNDGVNITRSSVYFKPGASKWWDGYFANEVVIIDDYRRDLCPFHELLRLLDRYPHQVEIKGGYQQFVSKYIFITTPKSPQETWEGRTEEDLAQLMRRIDLVIDFDDPNRVLFNQSFTQGDVDIINNLDI